jgi:hypothetical protein
MYANSITVGGDVTISGNLTVVGEVTTVNVSTLEVKDPLIELASNNTSDSVDIGFYGQYNTGSGNVYTGFFRDQTDNKFKVFTGLTDKPTATVDVSNTSYTVATLVAYLESGALVSNSTTVAITANSTVNVAIVANTLSLSSALTVNNGGTGQTTFTNNAILLGNTTGPLSSVSSTTEGHVLQINSSGVPEFAMLDGGSF